MPTDRRPLIAVAACLKRNEDLRSHSVSDKYPAAVIAAAAGTPVIMPAIGDALDIAALLEVFDGFLFPGSPSNVEPHHYDGEPSREGTLHDPERDATTLPLLRAAIEYGAPVLALCRGCQELNVACGGSLHQNVHEFPGHLDHRSPKHLPRPERYAPDHHAVRFSTGGLLERLAGAPEAMVNSLHWQAIDRLADDLIVEARAPDGVIEAVRHRRDDTFILGIQWHPEACVGYDPLSRAIFAEFGRAARHASRRTREGAAA